MNSQEESLFDFITDEEFRHSLESDASELSSSLSQGSHKAAHVLAGSIVEAVLIDFLISEGLVTREAGLKLALGDAVAQCKQAKAISDRAVDLSSVIRGYRNLIHPGRVLRLQEVIDADSAAVASSVVRVIVSEISANRRSKHGPTATQIVAKIQGDPASAGVVGHLIGDMDQRELEQLLTARLPRAYLTWTTSELAADAIGPALTTAFRAGIDRAADDLKRRVTTWFARKFREAGADELDSYGIVFIRGSDLKWMDARDLAFVKDYLLMKLEPKATGRAMTAISGIAPFLKKEDAQRFIDPLVKTLAGNQMASQAQKVLEGELFGLEAGVSPAFVDRLKVWATHFRKQGRSDDAALVDAAIDSLDVPF